MKVAEARELESELQKLREENVDLRKQLNESSSLEAAKRKAEARVEQLEYKVWSEHPRVLVSLLKIPFMYRWTSSYKRRLHKRKTS